MSCVLMPLSRLQHGMRRHTENTALHLSHRREANDDKGDMHCHTRRAAPNVVYAKNIASGCALICRGL